MIKVKNIQCKPESKPETYNGVHNDDNFFYFFESSEEHQLFIASLPKQELKQEREVASWKVRAILKTMGLIETIETAINSLEEPTKSIAQIAWEYSSTINQFSPTVKLIQQSCYLTNEQIQQIFDDAEKINI